MLTFPEEEMWRPVNRRAEMTNRQWSIISVGTALLTCGLLALCYPVRLSSHDRWGTQIECGTGYRTNLLQATVADTAEYEGPAPRATVSPHDADYAAQCRNALSGRRLWAIPLAGAGGAVLAVELVLLALSGEQAVSWRFPSYRGSRPSLRSEAAAIGAYLCCRPWAGMIPANRFGVAVARLLMRVVCAAYRPVRGCRVEVLDEPAPGEWVYAPGADDGVGVVLLLHGSGYIGCSPKTHRGFASRISSLSGLPVFMPRYRLAPEHPFPAADDDAIAAYRHLLERVGNPAKIVVVGDSAGGHLAIALAIRARDEGLPAPAALALFSPLVDPSLRTAMADTRSQRSPISPRNARRFVSLYIGSHDVDDPRLSLLAQSLVGLPPVELHYGTLELLRAEAELFAARVKAAGGSCRQRIWPNLVHGYWLLPGVIPEARDSVRLAGQFIRDAVRVSECEPGRQEAPS